MGNLPIVTKLLHGDVALCEPSVTVFKKAQILNLAHCSPSPSGNLPASPSKLAIPSPVQCCECPRLIPLCYDCAFAPKWRPFLSISPRHTCPFS